MFDFINKQTAWYLDNAERAKNLSQIALLGQSSLLAIRLAIHFAPESASEFCKADLTIIDLVAQLYFTTKHKIKAKPHTKKFEPIYEYGGYTCLHKWDVVDKNHPFIKRGETELRRAHQTQIKLTPFKK